MNLRKQAISICARSALSVSNNESIPRAIRGQPFFIPHPIPFPKRNAAPKRQITSRDSQHDRSMIFDTSRKVQGVPSTDLPALAACSPGTPGHPVQHRHPDHSHPHWKTDAPGKAAFWDGKTACRSGKNPRTSRQSSESRTTGLLRWTELRPPEPSSGGRRNSTLARLIGPRL